MTLKRILSIAFLLALIGGTVYILSGSRYYNNEGQIFGTTYHVKYAATKDYHQEIDAILSDIDMSMSLFKAGSTLSLFNANKPYPNDPMLLEVVQLSQKIAKETQGAFDITVAPLVNAWGFGMKQKQPLTATQVDSLRQIIGYQKLTLKGSQLQKADPRLSIDLGAIAKGYAVDCVARLLAEKGCKSYMVEIGGEVVVSGQNPEGKFWRLGVNKPVEDSTKTNNEIQTLIQLNKGGVATSGNYRNFYYKDGKKYAHTISPRTGYPAEHNLLSATIIAPTCAQADAYATACMVMGLEKAQAFVNHHSQLAALFIYADSQGRYRTWTSQAMNQYIVQP